MVLDPDRTTQLLLVEAVDAVEPLSGVTAAIQRVVGEDTVHIGQGEVDDHVGPCIDRYGPVDGWDFRCVAFPMVPEPEAVYLLTVTALERPTARATVLVPGAFEILDSEVLGDPPGTDRLVAEWTASAGAAGYFVAVRPSSPPECVMTSTCEDGWLLITSQPRVDATVPRESLPDHDGSWVLEIHALDSALLDHLTTGAGGTLFPIPPVQNVDGGFGVAGGWVSRSVPLP